MTPASLPKSSSIPVSGLLSHLGDIGTMAQTSQDSWLWRSKRHTDMPVLLPQSLKRQEVKWLCPCGAKPKPSSSTQSWLWHKCLTFQQGNSWDMGQRNPSYLHCGCVGAWTLHLEPALLQASEVSAHCTTSPATGGFIIWSGGPAWVAVAHCHCRQHNPSDTSVLGR